MSVNLLFLSHYLVLFLTFVSFHLFLHNLLPIFPSLVNNCLYKYCKYYYSLIRTDCCYNTTIVTLLVGSYLYNSDSCKTDIQTSFSISFSQYFPLPRLCNLNKAITVIDALELSERRYQKYLTRTKITSWGWARPISAQAGNEL